MDFVVALVMEVSGSTLCWTGTQDGFTNTSCSGLLFEVLLGATVQELAALGAEVAVVIVVVGGLLLAVDLDAFEGRLSTEISTGLCVVVTGGTWVFAESIVFASAWILGASNAVTFASTTGSLLTIELFSTRVFAVCTALEPTRVFAPVEADDSLSLAEKEALRDFRVA